MLETNMALKKGDILFSERIKANQSLHTGKYLFERL